MAAEGDFGRGREEAYVVFACYCNEGLVLGLGFGYED